MNSVNDDAKNYEYLITAFGEDRIKSRYCLIESSAKRFIENLKYQDYVRINPHIIRKIILDYFADIKRLKDFHGITTKVEAEKIAAYTAFWICRRKPLSLTEIVNADILNQYPDLIEINEWFAWSMLISMAFDIKTRFLQSSEVISLWNEFMRDVHYFLVFRTFTAQALELAIEACSVECMHPTLGAAEL